MTLLTVVLSYCSDLYNNSKYRNKRLKVKTFSLFLKLCFIIISKLLQLSENSYPLLNICEITVLKYRIALVFLILPSVKKYIHYLSVEMNPCAVKEESSSGHFAFCTNDRVAYFKKFC